MHIEFREDLEGKRHTAILTVGDQILFAGVDEDLVELEGRLRRVARERGLRFPPFP